MTEQPTYNLMLLGEDEGHTFELSTTSNSIVPINLKALMALTDTPNGQRVPTKTELIKLASVCLGQAADPYSKECGLMPVFTGGFHYEVWVAAQVRMRKALAQPDYEGFSFGWITKDMTRHEPGRKSRANPDEVIGAWGEVYRTGREPYYHEVFLKEFQKDTKSGKGKWETSPITMLSKVIRDQTHKFAFADKMGNLCTFDEMDAYAHPQLDPPTCNTAPRAGRREVVSQDVTPEPSADTEGRTESNTDGFILYNQIFKMYANDAGLTVDSPKTKDLFTNYCAFTLDLDHSKVDDPSKFTADMLATVGLSMQPTKPKPEEPETVEGEVVEPESQPENTENTYEPVVDDDEFGSEAAKSMLPGIKEDMFKMLGKTPEQIKADGGQPNRMFVAMCAMALNCKEEDCNSPDKFSVNMLTKVQAYIDSQKEGA
jgi:hypothetical protein